MALESDAKVENMRRVQDEHGDKQPPANQTEQQKTNDRLGNKPELEGFWHQTSSTDPEPLESREVPEGVTVLVTYDESNSGNVYVGTESAQPAVLTGVESTFTTAVQNTDAIWVRTPTAGDRVGVLFEADGGDDA